MRTEQHAQTGITEAKINNPGGDIELHADPTMNRTEVTLTPDSPGDETADDRIHRAEITSDGRKLLVRLPEMPATAVQQGGTTIIRNGGSTIIQSAGTVSGTMVGAQIINGNVVAGNVTQGSEGGVRVSVRVPAGSSLVARSVGGSITATGTTSAVDADTSGGTIRVDHATDDVDLHTSGGAIRIGTAECHVEARTSGGSIRAADLRRGGSLRTSGGDMVAHLSGNHRLRLRTSGGDISVTTKDVVSEDNLAWRTSGGDVEVNGRKASQRS